MAPSVQCRKLWLTPSAGVPCSNAAKTRNPLKLAGVPQTTGSIPTASRPRFTILWGPLEEILLLSKFFPIVNTCLNCEDIARQSCTLARRWRLFGDFLRPAFPASRVQHVSDLHPKFALRHTMCGSMANIQSPTSEIRRGKRKRRKKNKGQDENIIIWSALLHRATTNKAVKQ